MRVSSLGVARPAYYDRNATSQTLAYGADLAPHTDTLRATYTTAAGKKAYVETAICLVLTTSAPTAVGRRIILVRVTDATTATHDIARIDGLAGAVTNTYSQNQSTGSPTIYAGETLTIRTTDGSTGGTIFFQGSAKITQFDS